MVFAASCTNTSQLGVETPIQESATAQKPVVKNELTQKIDELLPSIKAEYQKAKAAGKTQETFEAYLQKQLNIQLDKSITVNLIPNPVFRKYVPEISKVKPETLPQIQDGPVYKMAPAVYATLTTYGFDNYVYMRLGEYQNGNLLYFDPWEGASPYYTSWDVIVYYYETNPWGGISVNTAYYSSIGNIYGFVFTSAYPIQINISATTSYASNTYTKSLPY